MQVCELVENMRAAALMGDAVDEAERGRLRQWAEWLRLLGDGRLVNDDGRVELLPGQCRCLRNVDDLDAVLSWIYDRIAGLDEYEYWASRAIVAARHRTVDQINQRMLDRLPGEEVICYSVDMQDNDNQMLLPEEYLNRQRPAGLPAHDLRLKVGAVVILLRNLKRDMGLVNGTRMIIEQIYGRPPRLLLCRILTGKFAGQRVLIPRILLRPPAHRYPALWIRRQFPVKLAYAM